MSTISDTIAIKAKKSYRRALYKAKKFPVVKHVFPEDYPNRVRIEICGTCNANCIFCRSGRVPFDKDRRISPELFENILLHLKDANLLTKSIYLHSRGEPFMHPEIGKILDICREHRLNAVVSTNASRVPNLTRNQWRAITILKVSMSGITEESYRLMYGLNLNQLRRNMRKIARNAAASCNLKVNWLQYTFNREEEREAGKWVESLGFKFRPKPAYFIQMDWLMDLHEGRLPTKELEDIKNYLLLDEKRKMRGSNVTNSNLKSVKQIILDKARSPIQGNKETFICRQWDEIIINDEGELLKCGGVSSSHPEIRLGNVLNYCAEEMKLKKYEMNNICNKCIEYELAMQENEVYSAIWNGALKR